MNRNALKSFTHNARDFLSVTKTNYKQWVFRYTFLELEKDLAERGDITTQATVDKDTAGKALVVAEEDGVVAGIEEIKYFLVDSDPRFKPRVSEFKMKFFKEDGDKIKKGEEIFEISGSLADILTVERVVLNLIMRMSGVATYTSKFANTVKEYGTLVTPTRKTLWGLLDKKACTLGGGGTHRLNLNDAILIKENHIEANGGSVANAVKKASETDSEPRFIEVEVESSEQALDAASALTSFVKDIPVCIMFDNMSAKEIELILAKMKEHGEFEDILFEASGGINEDTIVEYAKTGVDILSIGKLTTATPSLNFSLDLK